MEDIVFRCRSKRDATDFRLIVVNWPGPQVFCDCDGFDGNICSHIDATLVAGERAMVPEEDWPLADEAMKSLAGLIHVPPDWKATWRKNLAWRGFVTQTRPRRTGLTGRPLVCFTGAMPKPRKLLCQEAVAAGWETVDAPHSKITVLVAADPTGPSNKLRFAREHGIPILAFEEWATLTVDGELREA
jgi:hypothetical protein